MNCSIERSFVTIAVADWQKSLGFYQSLLQIPPQVFEPDRYAEFAPAGCTIALYVPRSDELCSPPQAQAYPSMSLCLQINHLSAAIAQLATIGYVPPQGIQYSSHGQEIYIYDPNGNRIILYAPN